MKIEEAIENLKEEAEFEQDAGNLIMVDSINLSIEALKRLCYARQIGELVMGALLPGETKE